MWMAKVPLPVLTVLLCMALTFAVSDSQSMQQRIHSIHNDPYTVQLSLASLAIAKKMVPILLAVSLGIFMLIKVNMEGDRGKLWERNYCLVTVLATICLVLRFDQCPFGLDDSFIDYRYVQHWLSGQFDYNPGEHVMGFTSHLHLIALWIVCSIFRTHAVDLASFYLNCAADTASTILLFFLVGKVYGRTLPALVASLMFAVSMSACAEVATGKETPLVSLVILLSLWGLKTSRPAVLPWCANALFLLRPEGIFSCLIILATALKTHGRAALKTFIVPCGLTLAWYAFLFFYFGSIMPHGMLAKHKVLLSGNFSWVLLNYVIIVGSMVTNSTLGILLPWCGWWSFMVCTPAVWLYSFWRFKEPCWALFRNLTLAQFLFLAVVQPKIFSWYFCWFALLGPIVMAQITADAFPAEKSGKLLPLMLLRAVICVFLFVYLRTGFSFVPYNWVPYLERGTIYREAALYLEDRTHGEVPIAASDVGILGYFYSGKIIDVMGLVSSDTLQYYPIKGWHKLKYMIPPAAISAIKPKYLMAPLCHAEDILLKDLDFQSHYFELKRWTNDAILDKVVCIWERKDDGEKQGEQVKATAVVNPADASKPTAVSNPADAMKPNAAAKAATVAKAAESVKPDKTVKPVETTHRSDAATPLRAVQSKAVEQNKNLEPHKDTEPPSEK